MASSVSVPVRPGWRYWLLVLVVAPGVIDVAFLWVYVGSRLPAIPFFALLALAFHLLARERARRRMAPESTVGWGAIGLLVSGLMAGLWVIVAFVVLIAFTCQGNCVS